MVKFTLSIGDFKLEIDPIIMVSRNEYWLLFFDKEKPTNNIYDVNLVDMSDMPYPNDIVYQFLSSLYKNIIDEDMIKNNPSVYVDLIQGYGSYTQLKILQDKYNDVLLQYFYKKDETEYKKESYVNIDKDIRSDLEKRIKEAENSYIMDNEKSRLKAAPLKIELELLPVIRDAFYGKIDINLINEVPILKRLYQKYDTLYRKTLLSQADEIKNISDITEERRRDVLLPYRIYDNSKYDFLFDKIKINNNIYKISKELIKKYSDLESIKSLLAADLPSFNVSPTLVNYLEISTRLLCVDVLDIGLDMKDLPEIMDKSLLERSYIRMLSLLLMEQTSQYYIKLCEKLKVNPLGGFAMRNGSPAIIKLDGLDTSVLDFILIDEARRIEIKKIPLRGKTGMSRQQYSDRISQILKSTTASIMYYNNLASLAYAYMIEGNLHAHNDLIYIPELGASVIKPEKILWADKDMDELKYGVHNISAVAHQFYAKNCTYVSGDNREMILKCEELSARYMSDMRNVTIVLKKEDKSSPISIALEGVQHYGRYVTHIDDLPVIQDRKRALSMR